VCDPLTDPACIVKSIVGGVSSSIFDQLAKWWTDAYSSMTDAFSKAFLKAGDVSISQMQSSGLWKLELGVGATIAATLMILAGARSAWTRSGDPIASGILVGIKAVFDTAMVFVIVTALLGIADQLTQAVINASAGDSDAFAVKVGKLASINPVGGGSGALVFLFSVLGVLITAVLWIEMLIRAAGIVIVTLSTPIGAAGLVSTRTAGWWRKMVSAEVALIFVKPIVALVLAIGFTVSHESTGIQGTLVGFMVLGAAAVAWPVVGRMFTFFEGTFAIGGMAAALGVAEAARGRMGGGRSSGGQPMWQSMEQASSRSSTSAALGSGAGVADVAVADGGSMVASSGGLGSAAANVGGGSAAGAAGGPAGLAVVAGKQVATKALQAPGQMVGHAADLAGVGGGAGSATEATWAQQASAPTDVPPDGGGEGA
jgi:type IV secretion system protein TrbL